MQREKDQFVTHLDMPEQYFILAGIVVLLWLGIWFFFYYTKRERSDRRTLIALILVILAAALVVGGNELLICLDVYQWPTYVVVIKGKS